jgi:glycerol-3-phosphate dehydrogenase
MAQDAVDAVARNLDQRVPDSVTDSIPVLGAEGFEAMWNRRRELAHESGLHRVRIEHLLRRHGTLVTEVLDLIADEPRLGEPMPGADDYLLAEIQYAASHEGALHLEDVLTRRTHASIEAWDRGVAAAKVTAELMAPVLGWDEDAIQREVQHYVSRVEAERESQTAPDDHTADAARMGAPDVRIGFRPVQ